MTGTATATPPPADAAARTVPPAPSTPASRPRWALAALGALTVVATWTRFLPLNVGLWADETFTIQRYVVHGPEAILDPAHYELNNHVLFSLLAWASQPLVGLSEPAVRLWGVLPALGAVALLTWAAWRRFGPTAAVVLGTLLVFDPVNLTWGPQARGYGLGMFSAAAMLVAAHRLEAHPAPRATHGAALGLSGLVGAATLPVMAVPAAAHVAVAARRQSSRTAAAVAGAILAGGSGLLYYRHVGLMLELSGEAATDYGWRLAGFDLVRAPLSLLVAPVGEQLLPWAPAPVGAGLAVLLLLGGVAVLVRSPAHRPLLAHASVPAVVTVGVLAGLQAHVVERYLSYLQPGLLVVMAAGAVAAIRLAGHASAATAGGLSERARGPLRAGAGAALVAGLVVAAVHLGGRAYWEATMPREAHRGSVEVIESAGIDRVLTNHPEPTGLLHYREGVRPQVVHPGEARTVLCEEPAPFAFVDQPLEGPSGDLSCLEERGAVEMRLPQRHGPGYVGVWLLPADAEP